MPLSNSDWREIQNLLRREIAQIGEPFVQGKVVKSDPVNKLIWLKEFGDQPIPLVDFDQQVKYYDDDTQYIERAKAIRSTALTLASGSWSLLTWDGEEFDNDNIHSVSSNTHRMTANTPGVYAVAISTMYNYTGTPAAGAIIGILVNKNTDTVLAGVTLAAEGKQMPVGISPTLNVTFLITMAAGDWIKVDGFHNTGLATYALQPNSAISMWRVG